MKNYVERAMSYATYLELMDRLVVEGRTTGPNQSEALVQFTKLNRQRMQRLDRTIELTERAIAAARGVQRPMIWLIITEAWCGDAAQNIPPIEKIAASGDKIETRYILRDEHPELIDRFLTNGARSIPKLIALDAAAFAVLGTWGARPSAAQRLFEELKAQGVDKPVILEQIQRWYNADRTVSLQNEFVDLIAEWQSAAASVAGAR
ncbi:MAG: thioredoxin family protein [Pyrinomonadaceae bacterium]